MITLPYWTAALAAAVGNLVIGLGVLCSGRPRELHRPFAILTGALVLWNLDVFCLSYFAAAEDALWWSRVFRPGMFIVPAALYDFVTVFRERRGRLTTQVVVLGYAVGIFFSVADFEGAMISGVRRLYSGYWPVVRPLYSAFIGVMLVSFILFLAILVHEYQTTESPRRRVQAKFWLLGAVVALPLASANLLPFFGIDVYPVGSLGNLICMGIFAYAIVHHRLVDTDVIITKGVAMLAGAVLVVVPLCLLGAWLDQQAFGRVDYNRVLIAVVMLLVAGLAFPRVTGITKDRLSRTLFREKVEHRRALSAFGRYAARVREPATLLAQLRAVLRTAMGVEATTLLMTETHGQVATVVGADAVEPSLDPRGPLAKALHTCDDVLVREELSARNDGDDGIPGALAASGYEVAVPLRASGRLIGCVLVGSKPDREAFSREDLQLLATLGNSTAIAVDNARLSDELRTSQRMVARASRLSAVGTLAAGVAHEVRNPLVAVQTFLQLLPERIGDAEFIDSFRRLSLNEIGRIGRLLGELLGLAHSPVHEPTRCDVRALAADVVTLLAASARRSRVGIELTGDGVGEAFVDPARLKQVLMNLILNAMEASPPDSHVTVAVRTVRRGAGGAACHIEVRDEGHGIPPEQHDSVFTPFFTTKDSGTGLGLAVAHQIVTEQGGEIGFTSEVGMGTVFTLDLPVPPPACSVVRNNPPCRV